MRLLNRPAFYVIVLLVFAMLFLTVWLQWKVGQLSEQKGIQESRPAAVSDRP